MSGEFNLSDKRFWLEKSQVQNKKYREGSWKKKLSYLNQPRYLEKDVREAVKNILEKWKAKCKRMEIMSGDVAYYELNEIIKSEVGEELVK